MFFLNEYMESPIERNFPSTSQHHQLDMAETYEENSLPSRSIHEELEIPESAMKTFSPSTPSTSQFEQLGSSESRLQTYLPSTSGLQETPFGPPIVRQPLQFDANDSEHEVTISDNSHYSFLLPEKLDQYGHISGVKPGTHFKSRKDLREFGVHRSHSICCFREEGLISIILHDYLVITDDGSLILLSGYNRSGGAQNGIKHQELVNALQENEKSKMPVRVIRSNYFRTCPPAYRPKKGYRYDGIYEVAHAVYHRESFISILKRIVDPNQPPMLELNPPVNSSVKDVCDTLCKQREKRLNQHFVDSYYEEEDVKNVLETEDELVMYSTSNFKSDDPDNSDEDTSSELECEKDGDENVELVLGRSLVFAEPPDLKYTPTKVENVPSLATDGVFLIPEKNAFEVITLDRPEDDEVYKYNKEFYTGYKYDFGENNSEIKSFKNEFNSFEKKKHYNLIDLHKQCDEANDYFRIDPKCTHSPEEDPLKLSSPDEGKPHECIYNLTLKKLFERLVGKLFKICPCLMSRELRPMSEDFEEYLEYIFQNPGKIIPPYKFERKFMRQLKRIKKKKISEENIEKNPKHKKGNQKEKQFGSREENKVLSKSKQTSSPDMVNQSYDPGTYMVNRPPSSQPGKGRTSAARVKASHNLAKSTLKENSRSFTNYRVRPQSLSSNLLSNRTPGQTVKRVKRRKKVKGQRELESLGAPNCTVEFSEEYSFPRRSPRKKSSRLTNEGPQIVSGIESMDFEGFTDDEIQRVEKNFKLFTENDRPFNGFSLSPEEKKGHSRKTPISRLESISVPELRTVLGSEPLSELKPISGSEPLTELRPISGSESISELKPIPGSEPLSELKPISGSEPLTELRPISGSESISELKPISASRPLSELKLISGSEPLTELRPISGSESISELKPISASGPLSELKPISASEPLSELKPISASESISELKPISDMETIPEPEPISRVEQNSGFEIVAGLQPITWAEQYSEVQPILGTENYVEDLHVP